MVKRSIHCQHETKETRPNLNLSCAVCHLTRCYVGQMTINTLSDDALLEIFDFYYRECSDSYGMYWFRRPCTMKVWKPLLDVCRRWRYIIFESPRRLHISLGCDERTRMRELLDIWPPLPISVTTDFRKLDAKGEENVLAALERHNHVTSICLTLRYSFMGKFFTMMRNPFPLLTSLDLCSGERPATLALPEAFLGGSAPRLERLTLREITYPALPKLVSSATHLVFLDLYRIPHSGCISPEAMADCLAVPPHLQYAFIRFKSPQSRPHYGNQLPLTRVILPALTEFKFEGISEYLEELVSRIDAPLLDRVNITFHTDIVFDIPKLYDFIVRSETIKSHEYNNAKVLLGPSAAYIDLSPSLSLELECDTFYQGFSWTVRLCNQLSPLLCHTMWLEIRGSIFNTEEELLEDTASALCLQLFRPFTAVWNLNVSKEVGPLVARALCGLTGNRAKKVLPALEQLELGTKWPSKHDETQEVLKPFIAARRLSVLVYSN
ncbi:hypothetical protein BC826DRAFT_448553 [Russula brevipes]|nr:hypothetical protein BC826DRAFT_448553 [Russula brevipes]